MTKIVAIADDLTGAADCASACAAQGMSADVILHSQGSSSWDWPAAQIVSIDADTRSRSAEDAASTTARLVDLCRGRAGDAVLFKKVDSTLRGNLAVELAAVLRGLRSNGKQSRSHSVLLAPALPTQGRTVRDGHLIVSGVPLHETDLWKDEAVQPRSEIAAHLADAGLSWGLIALERVRSGAGRLDEAIRSLAGHKDVIVCDAETDEDLAALAKAAAGIAEIGAWAGSAGLAAHLPAALGIAPIQSAKGQVLFASGPMLIVVGSAASVAREQTSLLAEEPGVVTLHLASDTIRDVSAHSKSVADALRSGSDVLVLVEVAQTSPGGGQLAQVLAKIVAPCAPLLGGVVATGGETARAVLDTLGIGRLRLLGEVEPGLPFSVSAGWTRPLPVLTKAGGFGSRDSLVRCRAFLRRLERGTQLQM